MRKLGGGSGPCSAEDSGHVMAGLLVSEGTSTRGHLGVPAPTCHFLPLRQLSLGTLPYRGRRRPGAMVGGALVPLGMFPPCVASGVASPASAGLGILPTQETAQGQVGKAVGLTGGGCCPVLCGLQGSGLHTLAEPRGRPRARMPLSGVLS